MKTVTQKNKPKDIQVLLSKEKSEEFFHDALCNGLREFSAYDLEINCSEADYKKAKASLVKKNPKEAICYEDVYVEILRIGGKLKVVDNGGCVYNRPITLADVHKRVQETPLRHLMDMINENGDATTADVVLQTVFFQDIVFG